jgi:hypothetical protein
MRSPLRLSTIASLAVLVAGFAALAIYCVAEAAGSGLSLVDAYWRGRLPWMGIIEAMVVGGATATIVTGALTTLVLGGWWRRAALVPPVLVAALWWVAATLAVGVNYAPCFDCPAPPWDPWAYAYSVPETALVFLVIPALASAALAYISPSKGSWGMRSERSLR